MAGFQYWPWNKTKKTEINGEISDEKAKSTKRNSTRRTRNDTEQTIISELALSDQIPDEWKKPEFHLGLDDDYEDEGTKYGTASKLPLANQAVTFEKHDDTEEYAARGTWTGKFDFLMSLLGYSVGLGNVWRFPYLAYNNGGGAFVIPFLVMLLLIGFPLMFMELAFGQFASLGPISIFNRFCPLFHGVGCGMIIVSSLVALYYNMIIAWTCFYMFASFTSELPWERCHAEWSSHECYSYKDALSCHQYNGSLYYNATCFNESEVIEFNISTLVKTMKKRPPAEEYFENYVLGKSDGIDDMGGIRWQLALCLLLAWTIVFLCLSKGVQSSGKVVYFTALFPYVVLVILFFRGITLPGAKEGIIYYLTPDFSRLKTSKVWSEAAVQIFFSLSPAWGGLITLASYNNFHNNCYKDALVVSISNVSTSIFAGLVIFSIVGYLAKELGKDVGDVVDEGAGLAFIVYPEIVTRLPVAPLWSFMFFFMLLTLGLDSQFALMETVITATLDMFPNLREKKTWIVLIMSICGFAFGLTFCFQGGYYVLQLLDTYASSWSVFLLAIMESIIIAWIYGAPRFIGDIEIMIGSHSIVWHKFFELFWKILCPATLAFLLVFNWVQYRPMTLGKYVYPPWANVLGWFVALAPIVAVPLVMVYKLCTAPEQLSLVERFKFLLKPTAEWGPAHKVSEVHLDHLASLKKQTSFGERRYDLNTCSSYPDATAMTGQKETSAADNEIGMFQFKNQATDVNNMTTDTPNNSSADSNSAMGNDSNIPATNVCVNATTSLDKIVTGSPPTYGATGQLSGDKGTGTVRSGK